MVSALEELERAAQRGDELPGDLPPPDQCLFLSLRALYSSYRAGYIGRDQAAKEKKQLVSWYDMNKLKYAAYRDALDMIYEISPFASDVEKHGCQYCRQMMKVFDRRIKKYRRS